MRRFSLCRCLQKCLNTQSLGLLKRSQVANNYFDIALKVTLLLNHPVNSQYKTVKTLVSRDVCILLLRDKTFVSQEGGIKLTFEWCCNSSFSVEC